MLSVIRQQAGYLWPLCKRLLGIAPGKTILVLLLTTLGSFTSGIGILLIVPLLESVGISFGSTTNNISLKLTDAIERLGIEPTLEWMLIIYVLLIFGIALFDYLNAMLTARLRRSFVTRLRLESYSKILNAQWQYAGHERAADFTRLVTHQVQSVGAAIQQLISLCSTLILFIIYTLLAFLLSPLFTLLVLLLSGVLAFLLLPIHQKIHDSGKTSLTAMRTLFQFAVEHLANLKIIKSFTAEKYHLGKIQDASFEHEDQEIRLTRFNALSKFSFLLGGALIFACLFYFSIRFLDPPLSNLLLVLIIFSRLMPQVSRIQTCIQRLVHIGPQYQEFSAQLESLDNHREMTSAGDNSEIKLQHVLQLENISFRYVDSEHHVLKDFSLEINRNETVVLTGPSGAGKSTLVDIIAGLLSPSSGIFKVDDQLIDDNNRRGWRKKVGYVTQEMMLFNDTVRNNLCWIRDDIEEKEIWQALEMTAAADFIQRLPEGLDTIIGDRGSRLSGGERQRLALARALLLNPELLILDEATNALDRDSEMDIRYAMNDLYGKVTMIVIAHNETTLNQVDQRIHLEPLS